MYNRLSNQIQMFIRKIKYVKPQSWIQKPEDASKQWHQHDLSHLNIKYFKEVKYQAKKNEKVFTNKLQADIQRRPISPVMGPITVQNPKVHDKTYRWCTCGQSIKQPFCDGSHQGTDFKPYKFTVQQKTKYIKLCGCKLTSNRPFCDGVACCQQAQKYLKNSNQSTEDQNKKN